MCVIWWESGTPINSLKRPQNCNNSFLIRKCYRTSYDCFNIGHNWIITKCNSNWIASVSWDLSHPKNSVCSLVFCALYQMWIWGRLFTIDFDMFLYVFQKTIYTHFYPFILYRIWMIWFISMWRDPTIKSLWRPGAFCLLNKGVQLCIDCSGILDYTGLMLCLDR